MRCLQPFFNRSERIPVPCGRCFFCRQRKRAQWTARLVMENEAHSHSTFLTLTYSDECLPNPAYVSKRELQLFFKRFRKLLHPRKIRYYACAEYGEKRGRPHYHAILFNVKFSDLPLVEQAWGKGRVQLDCVEVGSLAYVAGYVSKKYMFSKEFEVTGEVKDKEFSLMSRRPALGSNFIKKILPYVFSQTPYDVIQSIKIGDRTYCLDRTIREKLRKLVFTDEEYEYVKKLSKHNYAITIAEKIEEVFGSAEAENYLEYYAAPSDAPIYDVLHYENIVGRALDANHDALLEEERIKMRRLQRKDL